MTQYGLEFYTNPRIKQFIHVNWNSNNNNNNKRPIQHSDENLRRKNIYEMEKKKKILL